MKIFNRGNISYFIAPIIILILMYAVFTFTLVLNKANAAQNIKINSDFELFDQNNEKIKKFNLLGSPTVLFFGFTYCPDVCPTTLQSLSVLIDKLGKDKNKIKFYFVSIDPERDTPAVLKDYLSSFNPKINALTGKQ